MDNLPATNTAPTRRIRLPKNRKQKIQEKIQKKDKVIQDFLEENIEKIASIHKLVLEKQQLEKELFSHKVTEKKRD